MEQAIELSSNVAKAYISGSAAEVDELLKQTRPGAGTKDAKNRKPTAATPVISPEDFRLLDDSQRLELLEQVKSGKATMDEALSSIPSSANP